MLPRPRKRRPPVLKTRYDSVIGMAEQRAAGGKVDAIGEEGILHGLRVNALPLVQEEELPEMVPASLGTVPP